MRYLTTLRDYASLSIGTTIEEIARVWDAPQPTGWMATKIANSRWSDNYGTVWTDEDLTGETRATKTPDGRWWTPRGVPWTNESRPAEAGAPLFATRITVPSMVNLEDVPVPTTAINQPDQYLMTAQDFCILPTGTIIAEYRRDSREHTGWVATKLPNGTWLSNQGRVWDFEELVEITSAGWYIDQVVYNPVTPADNPQTSLAGYKPPRDSTASAFRNQVREELKRQGASDVWGSVGHPTFNLHRDLFKQPICPEGFRQRQPDESPEEALTRQARNKELVQAYVDHLVDMSWS